MTIDIDSLRALADAASPGPWEDGTASCCPDMGWVDGPKGVVCPVYQGTKVTHTLDANDAAFIAAARAAVPALLDEVERLRRDRDSYANSDFERQLSDERAEVERLRELCGEAVSIGERLADLECDSNAERRLAAIRKELEQKPCRAECAGTRHSDEGWTP